MKLTNKHGLPEPVLEGLEPANRCPDFDGDCWKVPDHLQCWKGLEAIKDGVIYYTGQAEGYCPFVIGQIQK